MVPNWVVGPLSALAGMLAALYVKDKAREIAKAEFVDQIKGALASFKLELLNDLEDTYARTKEINLHFESRDDRLDINDTRMTIIEGRLTVVENEVKSLKNATSKNC